MQQETKANANGFLELGGGQSVRGGGASEEGTPPPLCASIFRMATVHSAPLFLPQPMVPPFPLLLLSAFVAFPLGFADALPPSLFGWGGRPSAAGNGPPRPSFSPFTPFLSPQSLPPPLFGRRMPTPSKHLKSEEGTQTTTTATTASNSSRETEGFGNLENGQKWRGGKEMREEERGKEGGMREEERGKEGGRREEEGSANGRKEMRGERERGKEGEMRGRGERGESANGNGTGEREDKNGGRRSGMRKEEGSARGNYPMETKKTVPTNSSASPSVGAAQIAPFPQPPKRPFEEMRIKKERAELLVEKEPKTDTERVKKDGGNGEEKKRMEEEEERSAHNEKDNGGTAAEVMGNAQNVPLAGRFAPMRNDKRGTGRTEEHGRRREEDEGGENNAEERGKAEGRQPERKESRRTETERGKGNRKAEQTDRSRGSWERESSREWERGAKERRGNEWDGENRQRERGPRDREEEEGKRRHEKGQSDREEEEGKRRHWEKGGDGRAATEESLLFSPLQGPYPNDGQSGKSGNGGRRNEGRGERVREKGGRGGERARGRERWEMAEQQRSRNAQQSPSEADRSQPSPGIGRAVSRHQNSRTSPSSSSTEENVSRESVDPRQHARAVQQRPTSVHSRESPPPATLGFQRAIPDPNKFFPDKIREAFPPLPKPFEGLDEKHGKENGG
ncbi:hypothetical protein niasHT_039304 [Heterodera trifolii]|uniref:Uncharacterized protein n=1 Tax=Heterodera trifolii TaxID=157864 RepID=A0ABD2IX02_9BILA